MAGKIVLAFLIGAAEIGLLWAASIEPGYYVFMLFNIYLLLPIGSWFVNNWDD